MDRALKRAVSTSEAANVKQETTSHTPARTLPWPPPQRLEFDDGSPAARFCYYDHAIRFQRSPLIVSNDEVAGLKVALYGHYCGRW